MFRAGANRRHGTLRVQLQFSIEIDHAAAIR
jgi:hypothetical protein